MLFVSFRLPHSAPDGDGGGRDINATAKKYTHL